MNYIKLLLLLFSFSFLYSQDGVVVNFDSLRPKVALALSGGGARGAAQIGILQSFEENNIMVDYIAGTSVGSLVGGLYAGGYTPNELDSIISGTDWDKLISISNPNSRNSLFIDQKQIYDRNLINLKFNNFNFIEPSGLSIGTRFTEFLQKLFLNSIYQTKNDFNKLKYPFRAVATDLVSGESISFKSGNIVNVIKASATVPLRFAPIRLDSMILIDGGILANVPVNAAKEFNPDLIISINTTSPLLEYDDINAGWDIADQAISIAMREFQEKAAAESDIFITPKINHSNTDFTNLDTLVKTGYEAGKENIELVKEFLIAEEKFKYRNFFVGYPDLWNTNNKNIEFENFKKDDISHLQNKTYDNIYEILSAIKNKEIYNEVQVIKINNSIILKAIQHPIIRNVQYEGIINEEVIRFSKVLKKEIINTYLTKEKEAEIYERILKKYRDLAYAAASIEKLEFDDSTKTLNLSIDEGLINSITITGNNNTRNFIIKRDITFEVGEPVNLNKISETWKNLINSTLFDYVEIKQLENNDISGREIVVYVEESPNQNIRIGSRIDNERNVQIGVDFIQENLFGAGSRLNLRLVGGAFNQEASLNLANSRIAKSNITFGINPYYKVRQVWMYYDLPNQPQNRYDYNRKRDLVEESYGAKFRIGSQIEKFGILGTEFRFEKQRFYSPDSMNKPYFYRVATFKVGSDFDSRNNRYFPTNGSKLNIFLESSAFGVIEERSFSKLSFEYEFVQTISNHTFIPAFQFGAADETLPLPETFTMGGQNNFIGMMQDEMRGKQIIKASLDYRYKSPIELFFDTYFSIHYDMGSVWDGPETIRIADLRHGVGTSLSWDTPLGPLQFTVGRSFYFVSDPNTVILGPVNAYFTFGLDL